MSESIIRASEIGEYVYCRRAWWLSRVAGYEVEETEAMAMGSAYHRSHGAPAWRVRAARRLAYLLLFTALALFTYILVAGWGP